MMVAIAIVLGMMRKEIMRLKGHLRYVADAVLFVNGCLITQTLKQLYYWENSVPGL